MELLIQNTLFDLYTRILTAKKSCIKEFAHTHTNEREIKRVLNRKVVAIFARLITFYNRK